jgi:hypothetical protein
MTTYEQRAIEEALNQRISAQPAGLAWSLEQADWEGTCSKCGARLKGTIKDLKAHTCPPK